MKERFAAVRFFEDGNISERTYWYLCDFPVKAGDEVFAPVGARNRLQRGRVERTRGTEEGDAPYDAALCKRIAAPCGAKTRTAGDFTCYETGGVRYDEKRYTAFGRVLVSAEKPKTLSVLKDLGADAAIDAEDAGRALCALARTEGRALLYGAKAGEAARFLLALARGEETGERAAEYGLGEKELAVLAAKLL